MSIVSGCLLKGSVNELKRCLIMTGLSIMLPLGSCTGSVISVSIRGSEEEDTGICVYEEYMSVCGCVCMCGYNI